MYEHDMYSFTRTFLPKRLLTFIHIIMTDVFAHCNFVCV